MGGRQVAPFATYGPDGPLALVFASRARSFAASQTHWYRQLGWVPPSPAYLLRSA
jgi:hypothetical protein